MKILRILTGTHAGIQARLTPGSYRVGRSDDTDICITDWNDDEVLISLRDDGVISAKRIDNRPAALDAHHEAAAPHADDTYGALANARRHGRGYGEDEYSDNAIHEDTVANDADAFDPSVILIPDFVPFPFGNTALCFGDEDQPWPPDIQLLAGMYTNKYSANDDDAPDEPLGSTSAHNDDQNHAGGTAWLQPPTRAQHWLRNVCTGAMGAAVIVVLTTLLYETLHRPPASADTGTPLAQRVQSALLAARLAGLHVRAHGEKAVIVEGMVSTAGDDITARNVFKQFPGADIARQYDVAQTDIANLSESLATDSLRVGYIGNGAFAITGKVPSISKFRDDLNRVQADLDANVTRIDVDVGELPPTTGFNVYSEMIVIGDTRYVQTEDGVKHLFTASNELETPNPSLRESFIPARSRID
ncbi:hypothetical protein ACQUFY_18475 [Robbsia andropogonis]|uniref:hypothetical protein n=1 Tax=Robbsia andropogonis TaxID=28092 RepID=UPI003D1E5CA8